MTRKIFIAAFLYLGSILGIIGGAWLVASCHNVSGLDPYNFLFNFGWIMLVLNIILNVVSLIFLIIFFFKKDNLDK